MPDPPAPPPPDRSTIAMFRSVLSNRDLARVELTWALSSVGHWAFCILIALYAYDRGGTSAVAIAVAVRMAPAALAAPYASVLVDRHSRQSILFWSAVLRAAALFGAGAVAVAGAPLAVVLGFGALFTVANTAHRPAQAALMPRIARSPAELAAANVCWSAIDYAGFLVGSALAGVLVAVVGLDVAFAVCGVALGLAAAVVWTVPADTLSAEPELREPILRELSEGFRIVAAQPEVRLLLTVYAVNAVVQGIIDVLIVVAAIELLGIGDSGVGWLNVAWGIGGVAGGAAAMSMLGRGRLASSVALGLTLAGVPFVIAGASGSAAIAYPALAVMGVGFALVESALLTLQQRLAADDVVGRVFGVEETVEVIALGVGALAASLLVSLLGVGGAMVAAGVVLPILAALIVRRLAGWEAGAHVDPRVYGLVRSVAIFAPLPVATLENITLRVTEERHDHGTQIICEGDEGDAFFVIAEGLVHVTLRGELLVHEGPGDVFGEIALIRDVRRLATVTAAGPVVVLSIAREPFLAAIGTHSRSAAAAERIAREHLSAPTHGHPG